jgi:hypothetical protein
MPSPAASVASRTLHVGIVAERLLRLLALLAAHAAVDVTTASLRPEQRGDRARQVVQRVAVLGEDDELLRGEGPASASAAPYGGVGGERIMASQRA